MFAPLGAWNSFCAPRNIREFGAQLLHDIAQQQEFVFGVGTIDINTPVKEVAEVGAAR
jgi:hypothetical protein